MLFSPGPAINANVICRLQICEICVSSMSKSVKLRLVLSFPKAGKAAA